MLTIAGTVGPRGASIGEVVLTAVEVDGVPATRTLRGEVRASAPDGDGSVTDDETNRDSPTTPATLVCHLACGIGTGAREIAFTASTGDGLTVERRLPVRDHRSPDVCGGAAADGTHLELSGFE